MNIEEINAEFQGLIDRIKRCAAQLTNLDLLRIQLVYDNHDEEGEIPLQHFMATAWSKLAVYHAVCIQINPNAYLPWKDATEGQVRNGDYLVKMPDNKSLYIAGNKPYFYLPYQYDQANQLHFQLVETGEPTTTVTVPQWNQGSNVGRVWTGTVNNYSFSVTATSGTTVNFTAAICNGRYFTNNNEEIIYPSNAFTINISGMTCTVSLPASSSVNSYYIPYVQFPIN